MNVGKRALQLHELRAAVRSPIGRTEEHEHRALRPGHRFQRAEAAVLIGQAEVDGPLPHLRPERGDVGLGTQHDPERRDRNDDEPPSEHPVVMIPPPDWRHQVLAMISRQLVGVFVVAGSTADFALHRAGHEPFSTTVGVTPHSAPLRVPVGQGARARPGRRLSVTRLRAFWESIRATYWAVPSLMAVAAVGLSVAMIRVDEVLTPKFIGTLSWVYTGGPEGARAVLSTIAGSMITVAGVTFSITIVALTLASQQFGPRLLRSFLRDLGNQIVLGTFVSTFIYCLLVLRTVRGNDDAQFVPHLAVTLGVLLAMLSLGVLIFFIHHVSMSIQASQIIANVAQDLEGAVVRLFPERLGHEPAPVAASTALPRMTSSESARAVSADASGYVQAMTGMR